MGKDIGLEWCTFPPSWFSAWRLICKCALLGSRFVCPGQLLGVTYFISTTIISYLNNYLNNCYIISQQLISTNIILSYLSTTNIIATCMIVRYITVTTETCRQKIRELEKKGELTKTGELTKLVNVVSSLLVCLLSL